MSPGQASGYRIDPIPDMEADFGPEIPSVGLEGMIRVSRALGNRKIIHANVTSVVTSGRGMQVADPPDACNYFTFQDRSTQWIALISRQQEHPSTACTFDVKVRASDCEI